MLRHAARLSASSPHARPTRPRLPGLQRAAQVQHVRKRLQAVRAAGIDMSWFELSLPGRTVRQGVCRLTDPRMSSCQVPWWHVKLVPHGNYRAARKAGGAGRRRNPRRDLLKLGSLIGNVLDR